jgi:hypothetical protein
MHGSADSSDKVKVGGIHFDGEASHDERKRKYHPAPVLIAQNDALSAGESPLLMRTLAPTTR